MKIFIPSIFVLSTLVSSAIADVSVKVIVPDYKRHFGVIVKGKKTTRLSISVPECLGSLAFDVQDGYAYTVNCDNNCVMRVTYRKESEN